MHVLWQWSVATGHPDVNVHLSLRVFLTYTVKCGTSSNCSWTTCRNICSCCNLECSSWSSAHAQFLDETEGWPTAVEVQQGWTTRVVLVVVLLLLNMFVFSCASFSRLVVVVPSGSSDDGAWSLTAPQVGMLYRRCIRCCCFSFILLRSLCAG